MDFATTIHSLSWVFYNKFYNVLVDYGIIYLPLIIFLYQNWIAKLGEDANTSVVAISIKNMFVSVITFMLLYWLIFLPSVPLSKVERYRDAPPIATYDNKFNERISNFSSKELKTANSENTKMPHFWALWTVLNFKLNHAFLSALPKTAGDVRGAMASALKNNNIKNPEVNAKFDSFYNQCYLLAGGKFDLMVKNGTIVLDDWGQSDDIDADQYDWVGANYFVKNKGFYKYCSDSDCKTHPVSPNGFSATVGDKEIQCDVFWHNLRKDLKKEFKVNFGYSYKTYMNQKEEDDLIRSRLKSNQSNFLTKEEADSSGGSLWSLDFWMNMIQRAFALFGAWLTQLVVGVVTTAVVAFLPLSQALILGLFVILLPIVTLVSAIRIDVAVNFFMYYFMISFLTVIWAIIAFIDNNLINIIMGSGNGNDSFEQTAGQAVSFATLTGSLMNIATAFLYYQATTKWFMLMAMAGSEAGKKASDSMNSMKNAGDEAGKSGGKVASKIKK